MRIAINAWFLNQPGTGSGQYLQNLMRQMPALAPEHQFLLIAPPDRFTLQDPGPRVEFCPLHSPVWRGS